MRGNLKLIFLFGMLFACQKKGDFNNVKVFGHAATGLENSNSEYHDNSLEAIELACSTEGCDGVEIDVQLSKDGELYVFHDETLDKETNASGCIFELTSQQLNEIHYSTLKAEKLAKLSEIDRNWLVGKEIFLDLRNYSACGSIEIPVQQVVQRLEQLDLKQPIGFTVHCIISYDPWVQPFLDAGFNTCCSIITMNEFQLHLGSFPGIEGFVFKNQDFVKENVQTIKNSGKKVFIFEIRSPKGIRDAMQKMPDGLISDDIRATLIEKY